MEIWKGAEGDFGKSRHLISMKSDFIVLTRNFVALKSDFMGNEDKLQSETSGEFSAHLAKTDWKLTCFLHRAQASVRNFMDVLREVFKTFFTISTR